MGDGAAICFTFTPFPGVILQFGHGGHRTFPACGCDVCDDDPLEEAERMAEVVAVVVAGRFTETRYHRRLTTDIYESVMHSGQGSTVRGKGPIGTDVDPLMPVGTTQWARWTLLPSPAAPT